MRWKWRTSKGSGRDRSMWERRKRLNDQQMKTMVNIAESEVRTLSCQAAITVSAARVDKDAIVHEATVNSTSMLLNCHISWLPPGKQL